MTADMFEEILTEIEGRPDKDKAFKEFISKKEIDENELHEMFTQ